MSKISKLTAKILLIVFFCLIIVWTLFPIFFTIQNSVKSPSDIFSIPPKFIFKPTFDHWKEVLFTSDFLKYYKNSVIISSITTVVVIFVASMAGFALARFRIKKKEDIAFWILSNSMMPPIAIILPLYILFSRLAMLDTFRGIIFAFIAFNLPFAIWLMRSFFEDIPKELEDASLVDGMTRLGSFFRISIPLVKPGIVACGIYTFVMCINEFFFAFVLTGTRVKPASVAVLNFLPTGVRGTLFGPAAVAAIMIMMPAIILYIFVQKHFIRGLSFGAVKG
jgi:multiple sugar transport system permease protein